MLRIMNKREAQKRVRTPVSRQYTVDLPKTSKFEIGVNTLIYIFKINIGPETAR